MSMGWFTARSKKEKLESRYRKLLSEAHRLSQINRSQGDSKYAEAEAILDQIKALETES